ncbi:MAG: double-strand break repair helicase AddA [Pseudomonadota bacterium]
MKAPQPTLAQRQAADPRASAWVGANAGSGKTRVLIHRVARLLLAGSRPERILCLTYTRAAAAEMQTRLFAELGRWAMLDEAALAETLGALTGESAFPPDRLAEARRLFALALETPGGLRIQTIHAFAEHLIRRFPLEAGADPAFIVGDERRMGRLKAGVSAALGAAAATGEDDAFDRLASRLGETQLGPLLDDIARAHADLPEDETALQVAIDAHYDPALLAAPETVLNEAAATIDWRAAADLAPVLLAGGKRMQDKAPLFAEAGRAGLAGEMLGAVEALSSAVMKAGRREPVDPGWLFTKKLVERGAPAVARFDALQASLLAARRRLIDSEAARRADDLNRFALAWMTGFAAAKARSGLMDFDDLIERAAAMLQQGPDAAWVLYRLDGGIDHVLVDEAQDTSPAQWRIIEAIAAEFMAGEGAVRRAPDGRAMARTLFVVGDEKQSIYSFQGADPQVFGTVREATRARLSAGGMLVEPALARSFRSAPGILDFVDRVFDGTAAEGLTLDGAPPLHETSREGDGATIDLWDMLEREPGSGEQPWHAPVDEIPAGAPKIRLARLLATEIRRICAEECLPGRAGETSRPVRPGDIIVLVRRRDALARELVRALKAAGVAVAGADRLKLMEEIAVKDLLAALRVAAMPDDDLSLAALLRSPLGCLDEDALMALAAGRAGKRLSARLAEEAARHPRSAGLVADLMARADFLRPYEMLERVLTHHDGRRRLLARLGPECEDAIDELLVQALVYEAAEAPTLAGFVAWLESAETAVKREFPAETGEDGGAVRVMTVHGAKGLEAPFVILPDTMDQPGRSGGGGKAPLFTLKGGDNVPPLITLGARTAEDDAATRAAREAAARREIAEHKRLLYVALTRAERRLLICGAGTPPSDGKEGEDALKTERREAIWYRLVEGAMERSPGMREIAGPGDRPRMRRLGDDPAPATAPAPAPAIMPTADGAVGPAAPDPLPSWAVPAPVEARPLRLSPSSLGSPEDLGGVTGPAMPDGRAGADPRLFGLAVHALMESPADNDRAAETLVMRTAAGLDSAAVAAAREEAARARALPEAAALFASTALAEVSLAIPGILGAPPMIGRADRVVILSDRVLLADIKSDRPVPGSADDVPMAYAAQLGVYASALTALHGLPVVPMLLYTAAPQLLTLDATQCEQAVRAALAAAAGA